MYLTGQKDDPFQRYVCVYQDMGRGPPGIMNNNRAMSIVSITKNCERCISHPSLVTQRRPRLASKCRLVIRNMPHNEKQKA
jgi:hypothetical protein